MDSLLRQIFSTSGFMPHGHCYLWKPALVWTMAGSDLLIGSSYFLISLTLWMIVRRIRLPFSGMFIAFGLFILACGAGHLIDLITLWKPIYWVSAGVRGVTALASIATAIWLIPVGLKIRTLAERTIGAHKITQQLIESEQRFRTMIAAVKDYAIYRIDPNGEIVSWNEGAKRLKGYDENEVLGANFSIFYTPEDIAAGKPQRDLGEAAGTGKFEDESWKVRKDGTRYWASVLISKITDESGQLMGFSKVTRDLTERKRADERLKRAYANLEKRVQERTAEYQELMDTVDGIVWEARVGEPGYTLVSREAERLLGYPIERWLNEPRFWQSILHPEDRARLTGKAYLPPESKQDRHVEYRVQTISGKILWMRDHIRVIHEDGQPTKMRGIMVDITDRKNAERKLREAQAATLRAASVKEQFLTNMSHEIRTPLNAIVGMASVGLGASASLDDEQKDCLMTIKTAADSLLLIVNDILDYSKIEAGKMQLEVTDFKLSGVCQNALDVINPIAKSKGIEVSFETSPAFPDQLRGDAGRIMQILMNLLSNATKFTKRGGRIRLKISNPQNRVRIEVSDTGTGIQDEVKERLFLPFSQADSSTARKFGGTGLGLSICKRLVALMEGEIGMESTVGKGSTFWFEIPLIPARGPILSQDESPLDQDRKNEAPLRILVADDNFANQKVVMRMLEKLGHHAEAVANGDEAVTSFERGGYDLILMDCQMPEMDGYQATRQIRKLEKASGGKHIPIIALTAHAMSGDRKKCEDAGMDDYLSKPIDLRQLRRVLSRKSQEIPDTSPQAEGASIPALDHGRLKSLETLQVPGKPDIILELVRYFEDVAPTAMEEIRTAFRNGDFDAMTMQAHKLKSTCLNIGARKLASLCETVECRHVEPLDEIIEAMPAEFEIVSAELRHVVEERV